MLKIKKNILSIRNPKTGLYESAPGAIGASAYEIAKKNGYTGTMEEWLEEVSGESGEADTAGNADKADALNINGPVGNELTPVFFDAFGKPVSTRYELGDACSYGVTDNPKDPVNAIVTTKALKEAMENVGAALDETYSKAIVPTPNGSLIYNGTIQSPNWINYDERYVTMAGVSSAINAGTYTVTFTPIMPYKWTDGTTGSISVNWSIGKATPGEIVLSANTLALTKNNVTEIITVTRDGEGEISATSSNSKVASVSVSGSNVKITGDGKTAGTATITIKVAADNNYTAHESKTITVTSKYMPKIVTWADGTWDEIRAMLEAHYDGTIDIADYWSVGDTKTDVQMAAIEPDFTYYPSTGSTCKNGGSQPQQKIDLVIIGIKHDVLADGTTKSAITVQTKNVLAEYMYLAYYNSDESGKYHMCDKDNMNWYDCELRHWLNWKFLDAIPQELRNLIKRAKKLTNQYCYNADSYGTVVNPSIKHIQTQNDIGVFLPSTIEVKGSAYNPTTNSDSFPYVLPDDGIQYDYFKISNNAIKNVSIYSPHYTKDAPYLWWLRTFVYNYYVDKSIVGANCVNHNSDIIYENTNTSSNGIAPAFCL